MTIITELLLFDPHLKKCSCSFPRENISTIFNATDNETTTVNTTMNPVDATTVNTTDPSRTTYKDLETGVCKDIPSGVHLDVFYADGGRFNGRPFPVIVRAKIR